ncbi:hypothetical protein [Methanoculleus bourgensis]|uniref:hypothetical protein n=1 Tax=Methanoculleus bourgensis TaxID=83986 RepID=UPI002492EF8B|nr:hypothetical protein [Methanoculleus bourgensis]
MYEDPRLSNTLLASFFAAVNALSSWTIAVMLAIFCILYMICQRKYTISKEFYPKLIIFIISTLILVAPGLYLILKNMLTNPHMYSDLYFFIVYSADLLGYITPSPLHPILGEISIPIYSQFTGNYSENIVFIGYSVLLLSIVGMCTWVKDSFGKFILFCTGVFFILSLGPVLHIFGIWEFTNNNLTLTLPGIVTYFVPFLDMIRVPSRYQIMFMFLMSLISGYGFKYLLDKIPQRGVNKRKQITVMITTIVIITVLIFEFTAVLPVQNIKPTPDFYYSISSNEQGAIIELPLIRSPLDEPGVRSMQFYYEYQKTHQRPIMGGYFNRVNPVYAQYMEEDPVLEFLYFGKMSVLQPLVSNKQEYLRGNYNVSYIILHKNFLSEKDLNKLIAYLGDDYTMDTSVQSDQLIIYNTSGPSQESAQSVIPKLELYGFKIQPNVGYVCYDPFIGEKVFFSSRSTNQSGYLVYGPYTYLSARDYTIEYVIKFENLTSLDERVAKIDILSTHVDNSTPIHVVEARKDLLGKELVEGEYIPILLNISIDEHTLDSLIEFRVYQPSQSDLYVRSITVYPAQTA